MALTKPCPRCQNRLEIPQPPPDEIRCNQCGAVIRNKARHSGQQDVPAANPAIAPVPTAVLAPADSQASANPPTTAPAGTPRSGVFLLAMVGGLLLICVVPIAGLGLAWVFSGKEKTPGDELSLPELVQAADKAPKPPPPPDPRIEIVQPSVDKGVAYLKTKVPNLKGIRCGYPGLIGLTLLECDVPPDDPAILQIAEFIRKGAPTMCVNYDLSASLFFLNRWDQSRPLDERDRKIARSLALRIIDSQLKNGIWGTQIVEGLNGIWGYGGFMMPTPQEEAKLLAALENGTYKPARMQRPSMSNTQFAMLAVWGARKHGVQVREPLLALAAYFHANQQPDGCWNYPGHSLKATSTCAGLMSLAIESALLEEKEIARRRQPDAGKKQADVDKAFAFVAQSIGRKKGDKGGGAAFGYGGTLFDADAWGDLYFLWTLERLGMIYSKDRIGGQDWYDWGYPIVKEAQKPDGSWKDMHDAEIDTSFALLFLKRANIAKDLTEIIRTRGGKEIVR